LAELADEMAAAKEATDVIVDDLVGARDELADAIEGRIAEFPAREAEIDKLRFEAGKESDEKKRAQKDAVSEAAVNSLEGLKTQNRDDSRLMAQYETQIRSL
jgi:hypothetical protein